MESCETCVHWSRKGIYIAGDWARCTCISHLDEMAEPVGRTAYVSVPGMRRASLYTHKSHSCALWEYGTPDLAPPSSEFRGIERLAPSPPIQEHDVLYDPLP